MTTWRPVTQYILGEAYHYVDDTNGNTVAVCFISDDSKLIAAAPEMMRLLQLIEQWAMLTQTDPIPWLDDVTSIIESVSR